MRVRRQGKRSVKGLLCFTASWLIALSGCSGDDAGGKGSKGDSCEQASRIVEDDCNVAASAIGFTDECSGDSATIAECVLQHKSVVCAGLADASNTNNAFNQCIAGVGGQQ